MKVLLLSFLTVALLFTGCEGVNHLISADEAKPKAPAVSENANPPSDADIKKLQQDLIELRSRLSRLEKATMGKEAGRWQITAPLSPSSLESRLSALEKAITGEKYQNPWVPPSSLEDRVKSLEQLVKSKPWEVRQYGSFGSTSIEDRLTRIERQLGIGSSGRLWNP